MALFFSIFSIAGVLTYVHQRGALNPARLIDNLRRVVITIPSRARSPAETAKLPQLE
jgi:hypothetical protein